MTLTEVSDYPNSQRVPTISAHGDKSGAFTLYTTERLIKIAYLAFVAFPERILSFSELLLIHFSKGLSLIIGFT